MDTNDAADLELTEETETVKALTQEEVENWIMLKTQADERWFEMRFIDEDMNNDPTALALMKSISDVIYAGTVSMVLEERMAQAEADATPKAPYQ